MTNVEITYNPFLVTTDIRINGKASEGAWKERAKGGVRQIGRASCRERV